MWIVKDKYKRSTVDATIIKKTPLFKAQELNIIYQKLEMP